MQIFLEGVLTFLPICSYLGLIAACRCHGLFECTLQLLDLPRSLRKELKAAFQGVMKSGMFVPTWNLKGHKAEVFVHFPSVDTVRYKNLLPMIWKFDYEDCRELSNYACLTRGVDNIPELLKELNRDSPDVMRMLKYINEGCHVNYMWAPNLTRSLGEHTNPISGQTFLRVLKQDLLVVHFEHGAVEGSLLLRAQWNPAFDLPLVRL